MTFTEGCPDGRSQDLTFFPHSDETLAAKQLRDTAARLFGAENTEQVMTSPTFPRRLGDLIVVFGNHIFAVGREFELTKYQWMPKKPLLSVGGSNSGLGSTLPKCCP